MMMLRLTLALLFTLLTQPALAIVSMEDIHLNPPGEGLGGRLAFDLSTLGGNSNKQEYDVGGNLSYKQGKSSSFLLVNRAYGESLQVPYTDKAFLHLREIYQATPRLAWEAFLQGEQDKFARLNLRQLAGAGARFTFRPGINSLIYLGTGAFGVTETLDDTPGTTDGGTTNLVRANLYLVVKYALSDRIKLINSTYFQPALSDSADWRMLESLSLQVSLSKSLAWKLSLGYRHDNQPPQQIGPIDQSFNSSLEYRF
jgi:putative salt-induced outer membrane protein YdiY